MQIKQNVSATWSRQPVVSALLAYAGWGLLLFKTPEGAMLASNERRSGECRITLMQTEIASCLICSAARSRRR
jgi:hypothetical protein